MPAAPAVRPFTQWVAEMRGGALHAELSEKLHDLVERCTELGKPGRLQLTIKVKPEADGVIVFVQDEVKVTEPSEDRPQALYYSDGGNLTRRDPRQLEIDMLREVPPRPEPRAVEGER
jgi:hypothetical protein